jgi:hypothetical protein
MSITAGVFGSERLVLPTDFGDSDNRESILGRSGTNLPEPE